MIVLTVIGLIIGRSIVLAQERKTHGGNMMWSAMGGVGFLHDHMKSMIQRLIRDELKLIKSLVS